MVGVALSRADLDNIHIGLSHFQELDALFHGVAALRLLGGELDLHQHIVAGGLLDLLQHHQGKRQRFSKLPPNSSVRLLDRGEQLAGHLGPVAHVQGHRVKAQTLIEGGFWP